MKCIREEVWEGAEIMRMPRITLGHIFFFMKFNVFVYINWTEKKITIMKIVTVIIIT